MKKLNLLVALIAGMALIVAPAMGCGADAPVDNQNQNDGDNGDGDNGDGDGDGDQGEGDNDDNGDECTTTSDCDGDDVCEDGQCVEDTEPECTFNSDCDGDLVCNDDGECVEDTFEYDCELDEDFFGQIGSDADNAGGNPTTTPLSHSSGLQDVVDAIEDGLDDYSDEEIEDGAPLEFDLGDGIEVTEAVVIAVERWPETQFWLQDGDTGIYVRLDFQDDEAEKADDDLAVGDRVNFTALEATTFLGSPQLAEVSDWEVVESGTDVPYVELDGDELTVDDHFSQLVRISGQLTDNQWECGNNDDACFEMAYGDDGEHSMTFRTASSFDDPGDCVTAVAPVTSFPGYYVDGAEAQINTSEASDWGGAWYTTSSSGGGGLD